MTVTATRPSILCFARRVQVTACTTKQWESSAPTKVADRVCKALTECKKPKVETKKPTKTSDRECTLPLPGSCKALKAAGGNKNGFFTITVNGDPVKVYCNQELQGGGWTLMMRVSKRDGRTNFFHNGKAWSAKQFGSLNSFNPNSQNSNADYISPLYSTFKAQDIMVTESMKATNRLVYSTDKCLKSRTLHSLLAPGTKSCNGYACCGVKYGSGSPHHNSYDHLLLNGKCQHTVVSTLLVPCPAVILT